MNNNFSRSRERSDVDESQGYLRQGGKAEEQADEPGGALFGRHFRHERVLLRRHAGHQLLRHGRTHRDELGRALVAQFLCQT